VQLLQSATCSTGELERGNLVDVHQLRCFVTVAEELHFARAAERLHLTPSPVSRAVKDLERELGTDLFHRRYHEVQLTSAGEQLLPRARRLLTEFDTLKSEARAAASAAPDVLHVGGTHLAPPRLFDQVVEIAEKVADGRRVDVHIGSSAELLPDVESGALELALVHLPLDAPDLDSLTIARYQFMVAMRADDPLAAAGSLRLTELSDRTFAFASSKVQPVAMDRLHRHLEAAGIRRFHQLPDHNAALLASHLRNSRSVALTLAPSSGGASKVFDDPAFAVVPIEDEQLEFTVGVTWRRDRAHTSSDVAAMIELASATWSHGPEVY
jgi:DNA-binding transcriptional LysR family regulator